jgi:hypothetical protein
MATRKRDAKGRYVKGGGGGGGGGAKKAAKKGSKGKRRPSGRGVGGIPVVRAPALVTNPSNPEMTGFVARALMPNLIGGVGALVGLVAGKLAEMIPLRPAWQGAIQAGGGLALGIGGSMLSPALGVGFASSLVGQGGSNIFNDVIAAAPAKPATEAEKKLTEGATSSVLIPAGSRINRPMRVLVQSSDVGAIVVPNAVTERASGAPNGMGRAQRLASAMMGG